MSLLDDLIFGVRALLANGTEMPRRGGLNFVGATVTDNAAQDRTDVTISGSNPAVLAPPAVAVASAVGVSSLYARGDHTHAHGAAVAATANTIPMREANGDVHFGRVYCGGISSEPYSLPGLPPNALWLQPQKPIPADVGDHPTQNLIFDSGICGQSTLGEASKFNYLYGDPRVGIPNFIGYEDGFFALWGYDPDGAGREKTPYLFVAHTGARELVDGGKHVNFLIHSHGFLNLTCDPTGFIQTELPAGSTLGFRVTNGGVVRFQSTTEGVSINGAPEANQDGATRLGEIVGPSGSPTDGAYMWCSDGAGNPVFFRTPEGGAVGIRQRAIGSDGVGNFVARASLSDATSARCELETDGGILLRSASSQPIVIDCGPPSGTSVPELRYSANGQRLGGIECDAFGRLKISNNATGPSNGGMLFDAAGYVTIRAASIAVLEAQGGGVYLNSWSDNSHYFKGSDVERFRVVANAAMGLRVADTCTSASLYQPQRSGNGANAGAPLSITAQTGQNVASGTRNDGGPLTLASGERGAGAGTGGRDGHLTLRTGVTDRVLIDGSSGDVTITGELATHVSSGGMRDQFAADGKGAAGVAVTTRSIARPTAALQTTANTAATLYSDTPPTSSAVRYRAVVTAYCTAGASAGQSIFFERETLVTRGAGAPSLDTTRDIESEQRIGTDSANFTGSTAVFDVSGNDVRLRITPKDTSTWIWDCDVTRRILTP